jgi:peptide chain release factor 1
MLEEKLHHAEKRYQELSDRLTHPKTFSNSDELRKIAKEHADLEPLILKIREYRKCVRDKDEAKVFLEGQDPEMKSLVQAELPVLEQKLVKLEKELIFLLLPPDSESEKNAIMEIRAGTGGGEAALFTADLFRMYSRCIEKLGFKMEILSSNPTEIGGFREIIYIINGKGAFGKFRFESGTHRVQRIPKTEASGRIHTSAATVAVLPEADEVDVEIKDADLRIDTFCSSGAGGQSVNTTYSAVRITHLPTGMVVQCQDERSQLKNKNRAMKVLYARLKEKADQEARQKVSTDRKNQVGSGDRSEKIRTYNYPQNRITDHRINLTVYQLDKVMDGDLSEFLDALTLARQEQQLKERP